jgi:hypothetical protein
MHEPRPLARRVASARIPPVHQGLRSFVVKRHQVTEHRPHTTDTPRVKECDGAALAPAATDKAWVAEFRSTQLRAAVGQHAAREREAWKNIE